MYKNINFLIFIVAGSLLFQACKKEAALVADDRSYGYTVPQGNHSYDQTITNFYNKYGTYLLYKFTDKDTYWTPTGYKNATIDVTGTGLAGYLVSHIDTTSTDYITPQLNILNKLWFSFYSDKFLKQFLPVKVMLCSSVDSVYASYSFTPTYHAVKADIVVGAWYNYDNLSVNYGNAAVFTMLQRDSIVFAKKVNLIFMQSIFIRNLSAPTVDFTAVTTYSATGITTIAAAYAAGIITPYNGATSQLDWAQYIQAMVTCTETTLNKSQANTIQSFTGILNTTKDTNGRIRQRYNIVRNYFITNYGVDLQAIGNYSGR